jgi:S-adenosylmethionine synthetase
LRPDGKSQITIEYLNDKPQKAVQVVLAVPHSESTPLKQVKLDLYKNIVLPVMTEYGLTIALKDLVVNGTGVWHLGGPASDTGVTGRKIIVDTYGGYARIGGGCFSGKDPTKVDRSGAYAARYLAKNIVHHGLAKTAEVRLAYYIGALKPVMQDIETFGTSKVSSKIINSFCNKILSTSVSDIINQLNLKQPIYAGTARYGHFGNSIYPWEQIAKV